jgi:hypothetical protein
MATTKTPGAHEPHDTYATHDELKADVSGLQIFHEAHT